MLCMAAIATEFSKCVNYERLKKQQGEPYMEKHGCG